MSAWGKTGRVTLAGGLLPWVVIDERYRNPAGWIYPGNESGGWGARYHRGRDAVVVNNLPSLNAAVLWVLRRVDPALWRQERGAWLVRKRKPGEGIVHRGVQCPWNAMYPWVVVTPDGVTIDANASHRGALGTARARLRAEAATR